ncbi:peptidoglycan hydrolase-like protein with peptidoglycan-binding domain [Nocardiopsis mwathae]|uniref:Peptidoglycan hydrolase-like protein with peptidoglycan-binding domain n=1 Tax=Nocardiopsis mwathae TaxID=1472723 RepID=A0A7W9YM74_9ACTN|nr:peptidoglycan hydrolase-like protein with peptidoglycan-binding domain [Nocardiopsis mwathae]
MVALTLAGASAAALVNPADEEGLAAVPNTADVVRTTLVDTERLDGALNYERAAPATAVGGEGTLTWLPKEGDVIVRGEPVYRADQRPRVLLYGTTPFYRELSVGSRGRDVAILESNLAALGYTGFTADNHYTWATAQAVSRWQKDLGVTRTGRVAPEQVLVTESAVRVGEVTADLGSSASGEVLSLTGVSRTVTVDVEVRRRHLIAEDGRVEVELPDGRVLEAEVADVGSTVSVAEGDSLEDATVRIKITVEDEEELNDYEVAPVAVRLEVGRAEDVLAVPVEALVALSEGGYGVQTVGPEGQTSYAAVETGLFADGLVEVSGSGISEGTSVGVPE